MLLRMAQPQPRVTRLAAVAAGLLLAAPLSPPAARQPVAEDTSSVLLTTRLVPPQPAVGPATLTVSLSGATAATLGRPRCRWSAT